MRESRSYQVIRVGKLALLMTVGTGTGRDREEKIKGLAHGLLASIIHYRPEKLVFFGSRESEETIESLENQYKEETGEKLTGHDFILITKIDDLGECFEKVRKGVEENENEYDIVIDYTSGTKTMTTAASLCATLYHKKLSLVGGKRGEDGIVIPGTEKVTEQNLYQCYDKHLFNKFKEMFNHYRFGEARGTLDDIVMLEKKGKYRHLVDGYDSWDKFDHKTAFDELGKAEELEKVKNERVSKNREFLGKLTKLQDDYNSGMGSREDEIRRRGMLLTDLVNNAERGISVERYDDAVARLYRAVELIAQRELLRYDLDDLSPTKFTVDDLRGQGLKTEKFECDADEKGKLKLGLEKKFELLRDLGWKEAGYICLDNKKMQNLLSKRNKSILGHELEPIDEDTAKNLLLEVKDAVKRVVEDYEELKRKASFPRL